MNNAPKIPGLNDQTGLDMRLPDLDLGEQDVTISSTYHHKSQIGNPDGVNVEVEDTNDSARGFRINLGGKFPTYGARDCKRLYCAGMGMDLDGAEAQATSADAVNTIVDGTDPLKGKRVRVVCRESDKVNPKTGRKYRNVTVLGPATGEPPKLETPAPTQARAQAPATAPSAPTPPPAPAQAPAAPKGPPGGWFDFPKDDSRHGAFYYNAAGETRPA